MLKYWARIVVVCVLVHASIRAVPQIQNSTAASSQKIPAGSGNSRKPDAELRSAHTQQNADSSIHTPGVEDSPGSYPQPRINLIAPPPAPSPWQIHPRIAWAAIIVLVVAGYSCVIVAVSLLTVIKRQMKSIESIAQAVVENADAATLNAQAMIDSQRPWILMKAEQTPNKPNSFKISATNLGRTATEIIDCPDTVCIASDELHLPKNGVHAIGKRDVLSFPILLLPGESTIMQRFGRGDLNWVCKSEESLNRVISAEESIFIYGSVTYRGMSLSNKENSYRTNWCFRYIHGESASELVKGGPFEYNRHT